MLFLKFCDHIFPCLFFFFFDLVLEDVNLKHIFLNLFCFRPYTNYSVFLFFFFSYTLFFFFRFFSLFFFVSFFLRFYLFVSYFPFNFFFFFPFEFPFVLIALFPFFYFSFSNKCLSFFVNAFYMSLNRLLFCLFVFQFTAAIRFPASPFLDSFSHFPASSGFSGEW